MAKNYVGAQLRATVTGPSGGIASGAVFAGAHGIGVAVSDIAEGAAGGVGVSGVWALPCKSADVIAFGDRLYWDASPGELTLTATSNVPAGLAMSAAGAGVTTVDCAINAGAAGEPV